LDLRIHVLLPDVVYKVRVHFNFSLKRLAHRFHWLMTATPVPWSTSGFGGLLSWMQDPDDNEDALYLLRKRDLPNPYLEPPESPYRKYAYTYAAFDKFVKDSTPVAEQAANLKIIWDCVMLRRTYRSSYMTHLNGDVHWLINMLPESRPYRISFKNRDATVEGNDHVRKLKMLHDTAKYSEYLREILLDVAQEQGNRKLLPLGVKQVVPDADAIAKILFCFSGRSERIRLILTLIAQFHVHKQQKVLFFC
jgi:hypothetical protein